MAKKAKPEPAKIVRQVIAEKDLNTLLKRCRSAKNEMDEINGGLREKIAYAKEKSHLHTGAFGTIRKLDRMEPEALAEWLDHFNHMLDVSGLQARAEQVQALDLEDGEKENPVAEKVPRLRSVGGTGEAGADVG